MRSAPLSAHVSYLKRDGVTRDGGRGRMFDATREDVDDKVLADRWRDDRHHFRFIISPEDAAELSDLRGFTRDLVARMENDLGTRLEWVAIDHWNTDNPHVHLLVRGIAQDGSDLVIARDYISHGLRSRAEDLVSLELGPKPEHAIRSALEREVDADRWTRLDAEIRREATADGSIDLRPKQIGDKEFRRLMIGRLQRLERMGLAAATGSGQWMVRHDTEHVLRDLAIRNDIITTMHRTMMGQGNDRPMGDYVIEGAKPDAPIIGRLVDRGLHDELTGEAYAMIDGIDGRIHHVRFKGVEAFNHVPPRGGIVEVRQFGDPEDRAPTLVLAPRSDLDLAAQITAPGATWLDHRLLAKSETPLAYGGFGGEVRAGMGARVEHLVEQGLARRQGQRVIFARDLLSTLRRRELDAVGAKLAGQSGTPYKPASSDEQVAGIYKQRLNLSSGRFALIDNGLGFSLVPWSATLEKQFGQHVSGNLRDDGSINWSFGRKRGLVL